MEFGLGVRQKDDFKLALLALDQRWAGDMDLFFVSAGVGDLERAAAADLKAIVEDGTGGYTVGAKAGVGVVDLEELNVSAGTIHDGRVDVVGVAG